ncbi:MAG: phosphoribosyl-AMP cyclohydrolase [Deltaproteobacteria bacterium]|nr:phosphoribosyl-AMP cyclohydrolase [Deltaproteobacteria bacterium]
MESIDFAKGGGIVPVVVQDHETLDVLMLAYMNEQAFNLTRETGKAHYYSRSRDKLWLKGEESGHFQVVKDILVDCDNDTVILKIVQQGGGACHLGYRTCFFRRDAGEDWEVWAEKVFNPEEVYNK